MERPEFKKVIENANHYAECRKIDLELWRCHKGHEPEQHYRRVLDDKEASFIKAKIFASKLEAKLDELERVRLAETL